MASRGVLMGAWFVSLSAGGYLAGTFGTLWNQMPHSRFFGLVFAMLIAGAIGLLAATPRIRRVLDQVEALEAV